MLTDCQNPSHNYNTINNGNVSNAIDRLPVALQLQDHQLGPTSNLVARVFHLPHPTPEE